MPSVESARSSFANRSRMPSASSYTWSLSNIHPRRTRASFSTFGSSFGLSYNASSAALNPSCARGCTKKRSSSLMTMRSTKSARRKSCAVCFCIDVSPDTTCLVQGPIELCEQRVAMRAEADLFFDQTAEAVVEPDQIPVLVADTLADALIERGELRAGRTRE